MRAFHPHTYRLWRCRYHSIARRRIGVPGTSFPHSRHQWPTLYTWLWSRQPWLGPEELLPPLAHTHTDSFLPIDLNIPALSRPPIRPFSLLLSLLRCQKVDLNGSLLNAKYIFTKICTISFWGRWSKVFVVIFFLQGCVHLRHHRRLTECQRFSAKRDRNALVWQERANPLQAKKFWFVKTANVTHGIHWGIKQLCLLEISSLFFVIIIMSSDS